MSETTVNADHARRCEAEGTRDAIFLLQSRLWKMAGKLPGTVSDDQWLKVTDRDEVPDWAVKCIEATDDGDYICNVHQLAMEGVTAGAENALGWPLFEQEWITESVWLDRDEAEAFAKFHVHWFTTGWRVYAVCAEGELAKKLRTFPMVNND